MGRNKKGYIKTEQECIEELFIRDAHRYLSSDEGLDAIGKIGHRYTIFRVEAHYRGNLLFGLATYDRYSSKLTEIKYVLGLTDVVIDVTKKDQ